MNMKKIALLILVLGTLASARGQAVPSVSNPVDARGLGMGNAGFALPGTAYSVFTNTAALAFNTNTWGAGYTFGLWAPEAAMTENRHALSGYYKFGKHTVTAGARYYMKSIWGETSEAGEPSDDVNIFDMIGDIGYAFAITEYLGVSATVRYINTKDLGDVSGTAFAGDLGLYFRKNGLSAAISIDNFGSKVNFSNSSSGDLDSKVNAGVGYEMLFGRKHQLSGVLQAGIQTTENGVFDGGLGIEYMYNNMIAARAGYHIGGTENSSYATLGVGFNFKGFSLNAAYLLGGFLKNTLMLGLQTNF